jgi:transcriptional regulator GlxA family with amidase domain
MNTAPEKKLVVIVAFPDLPLLDIAGPGDVFFHAGKLAGQMIDGENAYDLVVVSVDGAEFVKTRSGIVISTPVKIDNIQKPIDTLLVAGYHFEDGIMDRQEFYHWLATMSSKVRRIGSICTGTFALARAGILENKNATTHWERGGMLQRKYPGIRVDSSQFFIRDGNVYTSGGITSGTDLALALVEEDYGRDIALAVARHLVVFLKRPGYQSQFGELLSEPELEHGILHKLHEWMVMNLDKDLSVEQLAEHSNMSPRNFARVFLKDTGLTPAKFVEKLRVEKARALLENTDLSIEQISEKCGLGSLVSMRRIFLRNLMVTPSDYRRTFKTSLNETMLA